MPKTIVVSFDAQTVHVLQAGRTRQGFVLHDAFTLRDEELDAYLQRESARNFVVATDLTECSTATFTIPAAKKKFLRTIIEAEIAKQFNLKAFEYVYTVISDKLVDRKRVKEVFVCAINRARISAIIDRFLARGKTVSALYLDMCVVAHFLGAGSGSVLGVMETAGSKKLFLVKDGSIQFVRVVPSFESGLHEIDLQNIIMTVNYCRQTLKTAVHRACVFGNLCLDYNASLNVPFPLTSFTHPVFSARISDKALSPAFVVPVACLGVEASSPLNLVPRATKKTFLIARGLRHMTSVFLVLLAYLCLQAAFATRDIVQLQHQISATRETLGDVNAVADRYRTKATQFEAYRPFLEGLRARAELPDTFGLLQLLGELSMQSITLRTMHVAAGNGDYTVVLQGSIEADGYAQMQHLYRTFLQAIESAQQLSLSEQALDLERKTFGATVIFK